MLYSINSDSTLFLETFRWKSSKFHIRRSNLLSTNNLDVKDSKTDARILCFYQYGNRTKLYSSFLLATLVVHLSKRGGQEKS